MEKKKLNLENVIDFCNICTKEEFKEIKKCDRIRTYVDSVRNELEEEIEGLQDDIHDLEYEVDPSYSKTIDFIQNADQSDLHNVKEELIELLNEPSFGSNNLLDNDKMQILSTAFKKYNLDQLMEKLQIAWTDVI